jgi:hypothetical protein
MGQMHTVLFPKSIPLKRTNLRVMPIYPKQIPKIAQLQNSLCTAASGWDFLEETPGAMLE